MDFSPFNFIPLKVRNLIYHYALCTPESIDVMLEDMEHATNGPYLLPPQSRQRLLALVQTCRQARHEALPIFLAENHFRLLAHLAIGSACPEEVHLISRAIFRWFSSFGLYASYMQHLEVYLGDNHDDDHKNALPLRRSLINEVKRDFSRTRVLLSITMEMELPGGNMTLPPSYGPFQGKSPPVPPAKIDFTHWNFYENQHSIDRAVDNSRRLAFQFGYATPLQLALLQQRRERAMLVLETLGEACAVRRGMD